MRLEFTKGKYGPYAEVLNHVLQDMEGHYIRGYGDRSGDAAIRAIPEAVAEAEECLQDRPDAQRRLRRVVELIDGFETPYGMELLTTILWSAKDNVAVANEPGAAVQAIHLWSDRKRRLFNPDHVRIAWERLRTMGWLQPAC